MGKGRGKRNSKRVGKRLTNRVIIESSLQTDIELQKVIASKKTFKHFGIMILCCGTSYEVHYKSKGGKGTERKHSID